MPARAMRLGIVAALTLFVLVGASPKWSRQGSREVGSRSGLPVPFSAVSVAQASEAPNAGNPAVPGAAVCGPVWTTATTPSVGSGDNWLEAK